MLKLDRVPKGIDPADANKWLLRCMSCATAVPIWEAKGEGEIKKCPKCRSTLSVLNPNKPEPTVPEEEVTKPEVPPMNTMRALLLQALMGTSLDPMIQVLDKVAFKIDLLTSEMKTRNKIEEAKITYNKALDEARAGIKTMLKIQEKERRDAAEKRPGVGNTG